MRDTNNDKRTSIHSVIANACEFDRIHEWSRVSAEIQNRDTSITHR